MYTRRVQMQPVYGAPSARSYCRLRLPRKPTTRYVARHGDRRFIQAESADTLVIGSTGIPIHILDVRELRGVVYVHFWQVMFPARFSAGIRGSDVRITFDEDTIRLKFGGAMFDVEAQAAVQ